MTAITTVLWVDKGQGRAAAEFWASLFPDGRVDPPSLAPTDYPGGKAGDELVVHFSILGQRFMALAAGPEFKPNEAVSFQIDTADQAETDRLWDAIVGSGGQESDCGWCKDRWGFSWQITPRALTQGMQSPDPAVAQRVFQAMMTMRRIDVAAIERARDGVPADA
jgi:predicted 3-demethylubiquinone-9 3-methyltransferase (glyoxalase superfamily)